MRQSIVPPGEEVNPAERRLAYTTLRWTLPSR